MKWPSVSFKNKNSSFFPLLSQRLTDVSKMNCLHSFFPSLHPPSMFVDLEWTLFFFSEVVARSLPHFLVYPQISLRASWSVSRSSKGLSFLSLSSLFLSLSSTILFLFRRVITCRWQEEREICRFLFYYSLFFSFGKRILSRCGVKEEVRERNGIKIVQNGFFFPNPLFETQAFG